MKRILMFLLHLSLLFCIFGCNNMKTPEGGGESIITGSVAYFYDNEETVIKIFNSVDINEKEITLLKETVYYIGLEPNYKGSKALAYNEDCAGFFFMDNYCDITYIGIKSYKPFYELVIKTDSTFDLTITVSDYTQTIKIIVK